MKTARIALAGVVLACLGARQDPAKDALRTAIKDVDIPASWIYDDVNAGFAEAKKSGKPLLVVFR